MNPRSAASTWSDATVEQLLEELVRPLVKILLNSGLEPEAISGSFLRTLNDQKRVHETQQRVRLGAMQRDCMEVMCRWRRDSRFLDERGLPATLPDDGGAVSFHGLCRAAGARSEPALIRETLQEFGAIEAVAGNLLRPLTPTFLLGNGRADVAADGLLKQVAAFLRVVDHNTSRSDHVLPRFERMCTVVIANELLPVFERTVRERGQEFIDGLDEWLERHCSVSSASETYVEVGAGAYFVDLGRISREDKTSDP